MKTVKNMKQSRFILFVLSFLMMSIGNVYAQNIIVTGTVLAYIIHSGFISGYQNRYGDNLKPPTNVYHRMTA